MITITNEDNMALMARFPDKHFELGIIDPPYGIGESGAKNKTRRGLAKPNNYKAFAGGDKEPPSPEYFKELFRVSKNQIIWGANHFIQNIGKGSPCWIVWDKQNGNNDFADCEFAYTSFPSAAKVFVFRWAGMLQGDMANKEARIHPTQKPVALYKWLLTKYAKPGDKILDTHLGSGSLAIACHDLGFGLTACELDTDYFNAATKRLESHRRQTKIFMP